VRPSSFGGFTKDEALLLQFFVQRSLLMQLLKTEAFGNQR
jgi:hypothetical protein